MATKPSILMPTLEPVRTILPKVSAVRPYGSKILVEILKNDEILGSTIQVSETTQVDGAPQAYIVAVGPDVPEASGLAVGQRIYWTGRGTQISDPNANTGRVRALLEIANVLAILDEAK